MKDIKLKSVRTIYNKYYRIFVFTFIILWLTSTYMAYKAVTTPLQIEKVEEKNSIEQIAIFDYKVNVAPSLLYPEGGVITPDKGIFTTITDTIFFNVKSIVKAEEPIEIKGKKSVKLKLISEGLWEKEYTLQPEMKFKVDGKESTIINDSYPIDVKEIVTYIEEVQKEIKTGGKYLIKIEPLIEGEIIYENHKKPLDLESQLVFNYIGNHLRLVPEQLLEINKTYTIKDKVVIPQSLMLFNKPIDIIKARYISACISLITLVLTLLIIIQNHKKHKSKTTESVFIEKKYKNRLIAIKDGIQMFSNKKLYIESFRELLKVADEKDLPIFKQRKDEIITYYIIDQSYIYLYEAVEIIGDYDEELASIGSDVNNV